MSDGEIVHIGIGDGIATITLDSQHNRNALSRQLVSELTAGLRAAEADASVRAVVLTFTPVAPSARARISPKPRADR